MQIVHITAILKTATLKFNSNKKDYIGIDVFGIGVKYIFVYVKRAAKFQL